MKKMKKFLCMLLVMLMVLSLVACGSDKDKDDEDDKKTEQSSNNNNDDNKNDDANTPGDSTDDPGKTEEPQSDADSLAAAIEKMLAADKGEFSVVANVEATVDGENVKMAFGENGSVNGKDSTFGVKLKVAGEFDDQKADINLDLKDIFTVSGDMYYINLDALIKGLSDVDYSVGSFGIPAIEVDESVVADVKADAQKFSLGFLKAVIADAEVTKDGDTYTISISDGETLKKVAVSVVNYVKDNKDSIEDIADKSSKSTDIAKYADKLVNYFKDDLTALGVSEEQINEVLDGIKEGAGEVESVKGMFDEVDFDAAIKEIEDSDMSDYDKAAPKFVITVKATDDNYACSVSFSGKEDDTEVKFEMAMNFDVKDVTIAKPETVVKIVDVMSVLSEDTATLQNIMAGFLEKVQSWGIEIPTEG